MEPAYLFRCLARVPQDLGGQDSPLPFLESQIGSLGKLLIARAKEVRQGKASHNQEPRMPKSTASAICSWMDFATADWLRSTRHGTLLSFP